MSAQHAILVRGPNWVGDLVMATPGFRALRAAFPSSRITLQLRPGLAPLLDGAPWFDKVVSLESYHRGAVALVREARAARRGGARFDLGVCLPDSFSSALWMRLAGVERVAGFRRGGRGWLLHQPVAAPASWGPQRMVARERFVLELVRAVAGPATACEDTRLELFTTPDEEKRAEERVPADAAPLVALAPGASFGPSKHWPAASFARVGDRLAAAGARIVLVGGPDEAPLSARVASAMRAPVDDLVGALDLGTLKAVLRRAALLVCNDAGARHVAVAFGVPVLTVLGPTSLAKTDCNLEGVRVFEADVACRPCYRRVCPIDHRCMTRVDPEDVSDAAMRVLEGAAR